MSANLSSNSRTPISDQVEQLLPALRSYAAIATGKTDIADQVLTRVLEKFVDETRSTRLEAGFDFHTFLLRQLTQDLDGGQAKKVRLREKVIVLRDFQNIASSDIAYILGLSIGEVELLYHGLWVE